MRLSLQAKFILVTFLAVFGITTVISLVTAAKTRSALYLATEKQGRILAQTVSALIINELIYENPRRHLSLPRRCPLKANAGEC